ncbi:MAG: excinuclease ABC subunit UvrC [Lactobacillus mulieris]|mgnify:CR=1 FL=1|uniref:UvrABC system protein C n=1 Tax=Lactobacillus mulieris TaxID=2508708 RepID=A0AAP3M4J6_9LACO|nr:MULTISPECIES: excinuclease ABC subunit UvrC [Lactobacillus]KAA9245323.1 excinuclease ABC subunit UvrC [Lactobacillus jensenii]MCF1797438.1 excinuclease ABC subunit UvrC [Lactobacillus mulieris]MCT7674215.1 excinuclease ABC subunit UvrC [Lactobacillus mulieris]MCT7772463.1 excinuclease ABC subunit UvrC [Lactobacillus mulieris]MCW8093855.1 excinuclease ABC subunit UvrC [Lactobacillus mulieris]
MANQLIENKLKLLPEQPGCYLMKNINGTVIYVGKSKNLKNRVRSYFKSKQVGRRAELVKEIADFDIITVTSDKESFLLEITLIKKYQPYYNVQLKQGTGYPYIEITNEKDPQTRLTSIVHKDNGYYFGPYPNVYAAQATLRFIQKVWPLRRCNGHQGRPCLYYHMGQCLGACFQEVPRSKYEAQIAKIKRFLNGDITQVKQELTEKMQIASGNLEFERAAEIRDQLRYIEQTVEKQKIISNDHTQRDIFNFYVDKSWISVQIFFLRQAKLLRRETKMFPLMDLSDPKDEFMSFIVQFYNQKNRILPREVLVPEDLDNGNLSEVLGVKVRTPQRGTKRDLLKMAKDNAKLKLDEKFRLLELGNRKTKGAQAEIFKALGLPYGHIIESFDHSHIQGTDPVSACVVFKDGEPFKTAYRKYKLKGEVEHQNGADEVGNTREVVRRRYSRMLKEHSRLPDLILMDGGQIQVDACLDVLRNELNCDIPVAGMVKDNHHHTNHLIFGDPINGKPLELIPMDPKSEGFYLMTRIQDEVHRFAITFHRQTHAKNSLASKLDGIKGIGPKSRNKLLKKFGSLKKIKDASVEELQDAGLTLPQAQSVKLTL